MDLAHILAAMDRGITETNLALATPLVSIHDSDGRVVCAAALPNVKQEELVARVGAAAMLRANMGGKAVSLAARANLTHEGWIERGIFYLIVDDEGEAAQATRTDRGFEINTRLQGAMLDALNMGIEHDQDQGHRWVDFLQGEGYLVRFPSLTT